MNAESEDRIVGLWATPFLHFVVDGHDRHTASLKSLAERSPDTDLLRNADAAAVWLMARIEEAVSAYLDRWTEGEPAARRFTTRLVVHGHGDYEPLRNHPDAVLNGIFYVTVPDGRRDGHHRFDADSNAISFYDPRFAMNMGAIAKDPYSNLEKQVRPTAGTMIVWPSYVDYFVHPNLADGTQVSVHFEVAAGADG